MKKWEWGLVAGALGLGILGQIPEHDTMEIPHHDHSEPAATAPSHETVDLVIRGMT